MIEEPKLETSPLTQKLSNGGRTISVEIYRLEGETLWTLELVDEFNNSSVWDDTFETDSAALTEAKKTVLSEGIRSLIGPGDGKGNGEWQ